MTECEANRIPMKTDRLKTLANCVALVAIAVMTMLTGCATPALWDSKLHSPASAPTLSLSPQYEDVLVRYDEKCSGVLNTSTKPPAITAGDRPDDVAAVLRKEPAGQIEPRSYWLFASTNSARRYPSAFVVVTNSSDWVSIPVVPLDLIQPITNHADFVWLRRGDRPMPVTKPRATGTIAPHAPLKPRIIPAGTNALGQRLFVTNDPPEHGYYWKLSASPPRYVLTTNAPPEHGYYAVSYGDKLLLWH